MPVLIKSNERKETRTAERGKGEAKFCCLSVPGQNVAIGRLREATKAPITCEVLCLEMQVTQLVDVTDVHVLLVDLGFVEVLGLN